MNKICPRRLLVVSHIYPSKADKALGVFVENQVKEIKRRNIHITIINPIPFAIPLISRINKRWLKRKLVPKVEKRNGVIIYHPRYFSFSTFFIRLSRLSFLISVYFAVKKHKISFNHIIAHTALRDGYAASFIAAKAKKEFTVIIHGDDFTDKNNRYLGLIKKTLSKAKNVIVVSRKLQKIAEAKGVQNTKVIYNGILEGDVKKENKDILNTFKRPIILTVARLAKQKQIDKIIYAVEKIKTDYSLLVIGDGPEYNNLKNLIDRLGLERRVHLLGALEYEKVMEYMASCDIFVLASQNESFGMVYLEAMVSGVPIIASQGEGFSEFIKNLDNGLLVKAGGINEIKGAIMYLIDNPEAAKRIGEKGKKTVFVRLTIKKTVDKLLGVL